MMGYKIDNLTGIISEEFIKEGFDIELQRASRYNREFALALVDFKILSKEPHNLKYSILKQLAKLIKKILRKIDLAVRLGDKVLIVLPETNKLGGIKFVKRLKELLENHNYKALGNLENLEIEYSFAMISFPEGGAKKEALLEKLNEDLKIPWEEKEYK